MLYFSKTKIFIIYSVIFFLSLCAFLNLIENDKKGEREFFYWRSDSAAKTLFDNIDITKFSKKSLQKFSSLIKRMNLKNNKYYEDAYAKLTKDIKFKIVTSKKKNF